MTRTTFTLPHTHTFFRLLVKLQKGRCASMVDFERAINEAAVQLFGQVGGALVFEFVLFDASSQIGIVKVEARSASRLQAACTMLTEVGEQICQIEVLASSPVLASLGTSSREFCSAVAHSLYAKNT
mmetsp:Transcript_4422/g.8340  ORF Transcript_4422/g.8340 Transcript_4422/m.8340 type:complete len:127 (-) Transcript_4422:115-495(-)